MKSESIKELIAALAKAQLAFMPIKRTEKVGYDTKSGGSKKYNYAPLSEVIEATKKALSDNGLAVTQTTKIVGGDVILETLLGHSSGEWYSGELYVGRQDQPPQSEGSSLTYKRRYGMSAILCVASEEDDDAQGAIEKKPEKGKSVTELQPEPTPLELYEMAQNQKTGATLCAFAMNHGWTKARLRSALGIDGSGDIKNVQVAALVLFPKPPSIEPAKSRLVEEALKLGAEQGEIPLSEIK